MNRGVYALLAAQFLTALADNAILFTAIAMVLQAGDVGAWYVPALQSAFLVAFVALAPWVGPFADGRPKMQVLLIGNVAKLAGAALLLAGIDPLIAYALVGVGAAIYGPAKYGILPELVPPEQLVRINGWIEGSTIAAIVIGTVVGARVADRSITAGLVLVLACFAASIAATLFVPRTPVERAEHGAALARFAAMTRRFFDTSRARFTMLGAGLFWSAAAVLRLALVAWAPVVLLTRNAADIAELTLFLALGITLGAVLVPRLIPLARLRRARLAAYAMGVGVLVLAFADAVWPARVVLFAIGVTGGLFVVPVNAALQEIGHRSVGSGGAVALQGFFENLAMLAGVGIYMYAAARGADPVATIAVLGGAVLIATFLVSWHLPPDTATAALPASDLAAPEAEE